jgi:hypothetical protein
MVPTNGANTNSEICVPLSPTAGPSIEVQCTLPGHGDGFGGSLAAEPAQGARDGGADTKAALRVSPTRSGAAVLFADRACAHAGDP